MVSKIFNNGTNEDQVSFTFDGKKSQLKANEIDSYFKQNRKVSITINPDNQSKLVTIVLRGHISMAKSMSLKGVELFYILVNNEWVKLDPALNNLKQNISELVPDFNDVIPDKKIHYNLRSIGNAISKYNEYKDPLFKRIGEFEFTDRMKLGLHGSIGAGNINVESVVSPSISTRTNFGLCTHVKYNRLFSGVLKVSITKSNWENENVRFDLRTLDLTPLVSVQLYNKSNFIKLYALLGLNLNVDLNSQVTSTNFQSAGPLGLKGISAGYDFQLHSTIGRRIGVFASSQLLQKYTTESYGSLSKGKNLKFNTNTFNIGLTYFFKRF